MKIKKEIEAFICDFCGNEIGGHFPELNICSSCGKNFCPSCGRYLADVKIGEKFYTIAKCNECLIKK